MSDQAAKRTVNVDDLVGITIYRANQLSAYLGANGVNSDFAMAKSHLVAMYADIELAQQMIEDIASRNRGGDEPAPTTN